MWPSCSISTKRCRQINRTYGNVLSIVSSFKVNVYCIIYLSFVQNTNFIYCLKCIRQKIVIDYTEYSFIFFSRNFLLQFAGKFHFKSLLLNKELQLHLWNYLSNAKYDFEIISSPVDDAIKRRWFSSVNKIKWLIDYD